MADVTKLHLHHYPSLRESELVFEIQIRSEFAMSSFIKASVLGLGLLAGAAFVAQAQTSDNTASLPPGGGNVSSAVAPSGNYPGPAVGGGSISGKPVMGGPLVASGQYPVSYTHLRAHETGR